MLSLSSGPLPGLLAALAAFAPPSLPAVVPSRQFSSVQDATLESD